MISTTIRGILEAMANAEEIAAVVYQTPTRANVDLSAVASPMAVYFVTTDGTFDISTATMIEAARVRVAFIARTNALDVEGVSNETILQSLKPAVASFLARVRDTATLAVPAVINYSVLYNYDDTQTTGWLVEFNASERQGVCLTISEND